jgi:hypothetical protein
MLNSETSKPMGARDVWRSQFEGAHDPNAGAKKAAVDATCDINSLATTRIACGICFNDGRGRSPVGDKFSTHLSPLFGPHPLPCSFRAHHNRQ